MNPTDQNNQDEDYNTNQPNNQPNNQPTALDNPTDSTQSFSQPSPNSQSPNINISGPNIQTSSPKMPSMNFGRPETNQANSSFQPSPGIPPKKSKKGLVIALIILLLIAIAGASYYFLVVSKNNTPSNQQANSTTTDQDKANTETGELVKTTFKVGGASATVKHPKGRVVDEKADPYEGYNGENVINKSMSITSENGYSLMFDPAGGGWGCPELVPYKLTRRIPTATKEIYLSEYVYVGEGESTGPAVTFENLTKVSEERGNAKEGDTIDDCIYPQLGYGGPGVNDAFVISISRRNDNNVYLSYDQVKEDTEFMAMLQSLELAYN